MSQDIGALSFRINKQRWQNSNSNVSNIHGDPRESDQLRVHLLKVARYRGVLSALNDGLTRPHYKCVHTNTLASPVWVVSTQRKLRPPIFTPPPPPDALHSCFASLARFHLSFSTRRPFRGLLPPRPTPRPIMTSYCDVVYDVTVVPQFRSSIGDSRGRCKGGGRDASGRTLESRSARSLLP